MNKFSGTQVFVARTSTSKQDFDLQLARKKSYEKEKNLECHLITEVVSGASPHKTGYAELMAMVNAGIVEKVVCYAFDRITRDMKEAVDLYYLCRDKNVKMIALADGEKEFEGDWQDFMFFIKAGLSHQERLLIKRRTQSAMDELKKRGVVLGGSPAGWFTQAKCEQAKAVIALWQQGMAKRQIARSLGVHRTAVRRIIAHYPKPFITKRQALAGVPLTKRGKKYRAFLEAMNGG